MTSKSSFWVSCKENHKRRVWVWIVSVLTQMMMYVGVLTVYLSRIRGWNSEGAYRTAEEFRLALCQAAKDALGFQDNLMFVLMGLGAVIGIQGFSYLYDRRKVDMYHSVPVNKNKRFAVVYVNGIVIYLAATLLALLVGTVVAALQHAVNGEVMTAVLIGFFWNLMFFLVMYHTAILAVMITGNLFITLGMAGALALYELAVYSQIENLQSAFFETTSRFYVTHNPKLSAVYDYVISIWSFKQEQDIKVLAGEVLPYCGKWFILSVVVLAAAWLCYRKRPSEAAGRAVAFGVLEPVLKVLLVIPASIAIGLFVRSTAYGSDMLTVATVVACAVIACAVAEIIYDFDVKSLFKHLVSSGVTVAGIAFILLVYQKDLFGYDKYVPEAEDVESIAVCIDYFGDFWDEEYNYVSVSEFSEENMYLTNVEPVLTLAAKAQQENEEDMGDRRNMFVLYRLKSGREVGRRFWVDFDNPDNEELLNRIMGTQEFKQGTFQVMSDEESYEHVLKMNYSNGAVNVALPVQDAVKLREAYVKDMEKFDFSMASSNRPCGNINFSFPNWLTSRLDVYECFDNTIAYLKSQEAFYPVRLNPEDIMDMTVTNYHDELNEDPDFGVDTRGFGAKAVSVDYAYGEDTTVTKTFLEQEEFAGIVPYIYPTNVQSAWNDVRELDDNYEIYITFRKDTTYPYDRGSFGVYYKFYTGQVPEFVKEATALGAGDR